MEIEIIVEGEGLADVEIVRLPHGAAGRELLEIAAAKGGFPSEEACLFVEDEDAPLDVSLIVISEGMSERTHHVHRVRQIEVTVYYMNKQETRAFAPSARVQRVLDWALTSDIFKIDPAIKPEMELALHGKTTPLPKDAHIGRFVRHPEHRLALDLIRGVVPNG